MTLDLNNIQNFGNMLIPGRAETLHARLVAENNPLQNLSADLIFQRNLHYVLATACFVADFTDYAKPVRNIVRLACGINLYKMYNTTYRIFNPNP